MCNCYALTLDDIAFNHLYTWFLHPISHLVSHPKTPWHGKHNGKTQSKIRLYFKKFQIGLKDVFDEAIMASLEPPESKEKPKKCQLF